jgi:TPR repeat protein
MLAYLTSSAAEGEAEASFWYVRRCSLPPEPLALTMFYRSAISLGDIYYNGSDAVEVDYPKALQHYREVHVHLLRLEWHCDASCI